MKWSMAKFPGYSRSSETFTKILKLAGTFNIQNGIANTDNLQLQFDHGSLAGAGTMGLADQTLNLHVTTVLAKDAAQRSGIQQVGGLMSTVLSNSKGELVIPAIVTGTFGNPRFEPAAAKMAKMKLDGLLPIHDNPLGAAGKILGALTGGRSASAAAPGQPGAAAAPQKKPGLFDVIDAVRKKAEQK